MNYCAIDDLVEQYGGEVITRLTDKINKPAKAIDPIVAQRVIFDASAEIDLYLHSRYTLPLKDVPAIIKRLCCTLAFAYLHPNEDQTHGAHQRAKEARQTLKDIAKGILSIGLSESGNSIQTGQTVAYSAGRNDWAGIW